jgi:FlaA1/EpsC-like NDP-sugar epimerase
LHPCLACPCLLFRSAAVTIALMTQSEHVKDWLVTTSRRLRRGATPLRIALDVLAWAVATALAIYLRLDLTFDGTASSGLVRVVPIVAVLQILTGTAVGLYRRRWRYGSFDEVSALIITSTATSAFLYLLNEFYFDRRPIPQSTVIVGGVFGLVLMAGCRYAWRLVLEHARRPDARRAEKLLIYGAGEGGLQMMTAMMRSRTSPYVPVGLLDDDPNKQRLSIMGVSVLGTRADIARAQARTGATSMLIAVPSASARVVGELADLAVAAGMTVKVLPTVGELIDHSPGEADIRDLTEEDLLGRHTIETDLNEISGYLTGKRVLVTGAGGSIGSELCRQLRRLAPSDLIMLDRDESALHQVQLSLDGRAMLDTPDMVLADIRDVARLEDVFRLWKPHVVFHAAALKHLPLLEQYPTEAYKSNVIGTMNVLQAAEAAGVEVFVNISTDKAANPISVLGYSKRVAERLTAHMGALSTSGTYLSVRFGNVLGSRGSVLTTFRSQITAGGPITDRDVTRFFMTIPEAVQLVIQAGAIGRSGEVLVLDMGDPVRIFDVARRLAAQSALPIKIEFTGLRPGEKLHEELFGDGELDHRPRHKLISHANVPPVDPADVLEHDVEVRWLLVSLK